MLIHFYSIRYRFRQTRTFNPPESFHHFSFDIFLAGTSFLVVTAQATIQLFIDIKKLLLVVLIF